MRTIDRRAFLSESTRYTAALAAAGLLTPRRATRAADAPSKASANDRLRVAVIGLRWRGTEHLGDLRKEGWLRQGNHCEVATLCDVDPAVIGQAMQTAEKIQGKAPRYEKDYRKVLDDPSIDIISVALPNHWHALAGIWALQAGKHVYMEKPVCHNLWEGRQLVKAARKYGKICAGGTQIRSKSGIRSAMQFLHEGGIGTVRLARGLCYKSRPSIGRVVGEGAIPAEVNYDHWCGPGPMRPPRRIKFHYDWHWQWDFGNGDFGNQGNHQMDVARWGLNLNSFPQTVQSLGGRFGYVDDGETPNTLTSVLDFGPSRIVFEVRGLDTQDYFADVTGKPTAEKQRAARVANLFFGDKGYLICTSYTDAVALSPDHQILKVFTSRPEDDHFGNFAKAVRANNAALSNCDIEEGYRSTALCLLGNISYRLARETPFSSGELKSLGHPDVDETVQRMRKHLVANNINLETSICKLGPKLAFDGQAERFPDEPRANALMTREYRKGYEVPAMG